MYRISASRASGIECRMRRRTAVIVAAGVSLAGAFLVAAACGTLHVTPPPVPSDPVVVYIPDYGDHARLVLPRDSGGFAEYGFGEWRWYALDRFGFLRGAAALLVPTAGALGNREHPAVPEGWTEHQWILSRTDPQHFHAVTVERERSRALLDRLDRAFAENLDTMVVNEARSLRLVRVGSYWLFNQSSTELAAWLRDLDCRVRGWTLIANVKVHEPAGRDEPGDIP
jgi:hypothetical protein